MRWGGKARDKGVSSLHAYRGLQRAYTRVRGDGKGGWEVEWGGSVGGEWIVQCAGGWGLIAHCTNENGVTAEHSDGGGGQVDVSSRGMKGGAEETGKRG